MDINKRVEILKDLAERVKKEKLHFFRDWKGTPLKEKPGFGKKGCYLIYEDYKEEDWDRPIYVGSNRKPARTIGERLDALFSGNGHVLAVDKIMKPKKMDKAAWREYCDNHLSFKIVEFKKEQDPPPLIMEVALIFLFESRYNSQCMRD